MTAGGAQIVHVPVDDGTLRCAHAGSVGAQSCLVLLHGWTLDHRMWTPQLAAFAPERLVLAPDRRGFGQSDAPPDLAREAEDVAALLDHFGCDQAIVLGMSQAGRVALDFALRFGDRLTALILQGAPASRVTPGPDEHETIPIVEYERLAREGRLDEMKHRWREHALMRTHAKDAAMLAAEILEAYPGRDLGAASYLRDIEPQDLARITAPALVITGALDTAWRRHAGDALARAIPQARRVEIAGAGHLCNLDQPQAFNAALHDFLLANAR